MKLYKDGKFLAEVDNVERLDFVTGADKPAPKPPTPSPKPPATPVVPPPQSDGRMTVVDLGVLTDSIPQQRINVEQGVPYVYSFVVAEDQKIPVIFFNFAPQNTKNAVWDLWISEEPDGRPLKWTDRRGKVRSTKIEGMWKRRGDTFGTAVSVEDRDPAKRGYPIELGKRYCLNIEVTGGERVAQTIWTMGGNWRL